MPAAALAHQKEQTLKWYVTGSTRHHNHAGGGAGGGLHGGVRRPQQLPPQRRQAGRIRLRVQVRQQLRTQQMLRGMQACRDVTDLTCQGWLCGSGFFTSVTFLY